MNLTDVKKQLERQFSFEPRQGSRRNIVFWYDEEGVFAETIDTLSLDNAKIIKLYHDNMFAVKLYIEETDRESNLLVYSPMPRPDNRDNWLTDTIKYSQTYSTDETTLNLQNFKIDLALRGVMDKYKLFFRSTERSRKFDSLQLAPFTEEKIHLGVLSVLCKQRAPSIDNVVRVLLTEMARDENKCYSEIEKYGALDAFWSLVHRFYGTGSDEPSHRENDCLERLAVMLLVSHLSHGFNGKLPSEWQVYRLDNANCYVFVDNFMKNSEFAEDYNVLACFVADKLGLSERTGLWTIDEMAGCDTFEDFDCTIVRRITENITQNAGEYGHYRKIIGCRKNRRYYSRFEGSYELLLHACEYLELAITFKDLPGTSTLSLFENYQKEWYKLDSSYRHFILAYDRLHDNSDYSALFEMVENSYTNWYLNELSMKWCALWDDESAWHLAGAKPQQGFFAQYARRFVSDNERLIVIVSDGLRYEAAVELAGLLNREQKGCVELDAMFGVIPSYTALGMAALLPHKQIDITEKGDYEIGGLSTEGTENRGKILRLTKKESIAIQYDDLISLKKQQLSERLSGMKLIYIYHNTIDARGDHATTENEVFDATDKAFRELSGLIRKLRNDISAIHIIVTADHGYLYRRTPLAEHDKTPKQEMAGLKTKRRFILANEKIEKQGTQNFPMDYLTPHAGGLVAVLPRVTNCFKMQGAGTRYVHGGTTLQEVVIPVIRFKSDKNTGRSMGAKKVSIGLTNLSRKITSVVTHLTFFQNEPVDGKHLPLRVTAYFADESGNRISNENIIIAESSSKNPEERTYKEKFTLKELAYDKSLTYDLILKDEDAPGGGELQRIPFVIDLVGGESIF